MDEPPTGAHSTRWIWIAAIWSGVGLIDASQTVFPMRAAGMHHAWAALFVTLFASWLPWALATPLVTRLGRRFPPFRAPAWQALPLHAGALAAISLVSAAWYALLEFLLNPWAQPQAPGPYLELWLARYFYGLLTSLIVYAFILAVTYVIDSRERLARQQMETARLNEQLSNARFDALRRQMDPHFMFNTLNAISGLIRDNRNDAAVGMVVGLSEFLRRAAEDSNRPQVALSEEVDYMQCYIEVQKVRFAERLQVSVDIPVELQHLQVPSLILQPLVENALKHGISKRADGGAIRVSGSRRDDRLSLRVYNDGPRLPPDWESTRAGIGLSNLRTRLQILYGTGFELTLSNPASGGVEVLVCLPLGQD